jgi:hypothetical protein
MLRRAFKASACLYLTASILKGFSLAQAKTPGKTAKTAKLKHDAQLEEPIARPTPSPQQLQELKKPLALEAAISSPRRTILPCAYRLPRLRRNMEIFRWLRPHICLDRISSGKPTGPVAKKSYFGRRRSSLKK